MKFVKWMCVIPALCGFLSAQDGEADRIILCFDNSKSMAEFGFYEMILESIDEKAANYRFVTFGANDRIVYYKDKVGFFKFVDKQHQYTTTNFKVLIDFLLDHDTDSWMIEQDTGGAIGPGRLQVVSDVIEFHQNKKLSLKSGDKVVILSDGVNDKQSLNSVSNFTVGEVKDVLRLIRETRKRVDIPFDTIQIMRPALFADWLLNIKPIPLREFQGYQNVDDDLMLDSAKVIGLSKGFFKALAGERGSYYFCRSNRDAVRAVEKVLKIQTPLTCDPEYHKDIRIHWSFKPAYFSGWERFDNSLKNEKLCMGGVNRSLAYVDDPQDADFSLEIHMLQEDFYRISLNDHIVWGDRKIDDLDTFQSFTDQLMKQIEHQVDSADEDGELANYAVPECSFNIVLTDPNMFGFITSSNLKIRAGECGSQPYRPEMALVSMSNRRIRVTAPVNAQELILTFEGGRDPADTRSQAIAISPDYFETVDSQFEINSIGYPEFSFDFSDFLLEKQGDILVYSDQGRQERFIDMVRFEKPDKSITFYKDYYYHIYYIPPPDKDYIIKKIRRRLANEDSVRTVLNQFQYNDYERNFKDWKTPMDNFIAAPDENSRNTILGQIAKSDAFVKFFMNIGEILDNATYRGIFKDIIKQTLEKIVYVSTEDPFPLIRLLKDQSSGYADVLRQRYIDQYEGRRDEMTNIFHLLSNPKGNLNEFLNYIDNKPNQVSKENAYIFHGFVGIEGD